MANNSYQLPLRIKKPQNPAAGSNPFDARRIPRQLERTREWEGEERAFSAAKRELDAATDALNAAPDRLERFLASLDLSKPSLPLQKRHQRLDALRMVFSEHVQP